MGNSTTARQLVQMGLAGTGGGFLASHGNPVSDPINFLTGALTGVAATHGVSRITGSVNQRLARQIAEMLVSDDPAVIHNALEQVAHTPAMLQNLRRASTRLSGRALPGAAAGTAASQTSSQPSLPRLQSLDQ